MQIQPAIIATTRENGSFAMHLTTMGFYVLPVRLNMVEVSNVLQQ